ncbi:MAG: hypothetical protein JRN35_09845 [Nitrososphaerota archaeon]|nr:hypothetical protein [Nitrososphaerota archaeon]
MPVIPQDFFVMSDLYPKCKKCGSFRVAKFEELTMDRPEKADDGKPLLWIGNALLLKRFVCLDCGERNIDWDDIEVADERLLP